MTDQCNSCKWGRHMDCWGCACPCNADDDEPDTEEARVERMWEEAGAREAHE